jgi:hypothetical protein
LLSSLHTSLTWVAGIVTTLVIIRLVAGMVLKQAYARWTQRMMLAFVGLMTLQWAVGILLFLVRGDFDRINFWSHALMMTFAVGVAHQYRRWTTAEDNIRYRTSLLLVSAVLLIVLVGVILLFTP